MWVRECLHISWLHVNNIQIHFNNEQYIHLILTVQLIFFSKYIRVLVDINNISNWFHFDWRIERWIVIVSRKWTEIIQNFNGCCCCCDCFFHVRIYRSSNSACTRANKHTLHTVCSGNRIALVLALQLIRSNDKCRCIKMLKYAWLIYLAICCLFMCNKFLERARHTRACTHTKWWIKWRMMWSYYLVRDLRWRLLFVCSWVSVCQSWHKLL